MGLFTKTKKEKPLSEDEQQAQSQSSSPNEQLKFVCQGAKLKCTYCPAPGQLMVSSTTIMLGSVPWATEQDKQPSNILFTGPCTHPSQHKPLMPPPPCAGVMQLGQWKDVATIEVGNYHPLLMKSKIPCMISGQDIEIIQCGQMN